MKKRLLLFFAVLCLLGGTAMADDATPTLTLQVHAGDQADQALYDAAATEWTAWNAGTSGTRFTDNQGNYGGSYIVLTKFNISEALADKILTKASFKFNAICTVAGKNSQLKACQIVTTWDETATWNNTVLEDGFVLSAHKELAYANSSAVAAQEWDITEMLEKAGGNVAFAIYCGTAREQKITDVKIEYSVIDPATSSKYTVKYVDGEDNEIGKTAEERWGPKNEKVTIAAADKAQFIPNKGTNVGVPFIYVGGGVEEATLVDDNSVLTVVFRKANKYNVTIKSSDNAGGVEIRKFTEYEQKEITCPYGKYILNGTTLYEAKANDKSYVNKYTVGTTDETKVIDYDRSIENAIFFKEAEDIATLTEGEAQNMDIRCSKGKGAFAEAAGAVITNLPAGKYIVGGGIWGNATDNSITLSVGDKDVLSMKPAGYFIAAEGAIFELAEAADLVVKDAGDKNHVLDYVYVLDVSKMLPLNTPTVEDQAKKGILVTWATGSENATTADLKIVYTVTSDGVTSAEKELECSAIDGVGYGAYVKDLKQGDVVKVWAKTAKADHKFLNSTTIEITASVATDIAAPAAQKQADGATYDLQGRRVSKPGKGLYIQNGKLKMLK